MSKNIIMRPVYNRPEMLFLSIEAEIAARNAYKFPHNLITLFIVEEGAPQLIFEIIKSYPFKNYCILRPNKFGLTVNILEGMKDAFGLSKDYIIYIEDDIVVHKTYFQYLSTVMNMEDVGKYSIISSYNYADGENSNEIYRGHHYAALAPLITKSFYEKYIYPLSNPEYYNNPAAYSLRMNERYKEYWESKRYKYTSATHHEQAGMINRCVDCAMIEEDKYVIMPKINRQIHIGFWGKNRAKNKDLQGKTFDERVSSLRNIISNPKLMYEMAGSKQYDDYKIFSSKLNDWDGTLRFV